jgi:hypothetical protein
MSSATRTFQRRLAVAVVATVAYCCFVAASLTHGGFASSSRAIPPQHSLQKHDRRCSSVSSWGKATKRRSFLIVLSSREDEIFKLEQQLRELKQQQQQEQQQDDPTLATTAAAAASVDETAYYSDTRQKKKENAVNDRGVREILPGKDMILTEQDLVDSRLLLNTRDSDDSKGFMGVIPTIAIPLVAAVALFFFAQVPVGQEDYMRYSAAPTSTSASKTIDLGDLNMDIKR